MDLIIAHKFEIVALLLAVSEVLGAFLPNIKANSVFELVVGFLKKVSGK
jgi:hypothetical protein